VTVGWEAGATSEVSLRGRRILIIEDESMVIMLLQDFLDEIGCEVVGVASRFRQAREMIDALMFDAAILDVNLNGQQSFAIGRELLARGRAIVFATGYGAGTLPAELRHVRVLQKPFHREDLERALRAAFTDRCAPMAR